MTVGELEHGRGTPMTSSELTEWFQLYSIENSEREERLAMNA